MGQLVDDVVCLRYAPARMTTPDYECATAEGTRRLKRRMIAAGRHASAYRPLGRTGLTVSRIGFGCYRVADTVDEHRLAMAEALESGCNLVDTSTNYTDGGSERLVGRVVRGLDRRDELVVVSKVGYVQGKNLEAIRERARTDDGMPDVVRYMDGCWHCIHPDYIGEQLDLTLERTGLERIDVYLLHNPEYFLADAQRRSPDLPLADRRADYYDRIERAFGKLEEEVSAGRISHYGVSSNSFGVGPDRYNATSVQRLLECAQRAGGDQHHFSVIQLPLNLVEVASAVLANNSGKSAVATAQDAGLAVLANRPLNALHNGALFRLADFDVAGAPQRADRQVKKVARLEAEFAFGLGQALDLSGEEGRPFFDYAEHLRERCDELGDAVSWDDWVQTTVSPEISQVVSQIDGNLQGPIKAAWQIWLERYVENLTALVELLRTHCARQSQRRSDRVSRLLEGIVPPGRAADTLSRKAVATLLGVKGVDCVLVGMRQRRYVADVLAVMDWPPIETTAGDLTRVSAGAQSA